MITTTIFQISIDHFFSLKIIQISFVKWENYDKNHKVLSQVEKYTEFDPKNTKI